MQGDPQVILVRGQDLGVQEFATELVYVHIEDIPSERVTFYHLTFAAFGGSARMRWLDFVETVARADVPPEAQLVGIYAVTHPWARDAVGPVQQHLRAPHEWDSLTCDTCASVVRVLFYKEWPREGDHTRQPVPATPVAQT